MANSNSPQTGGPMPKNEGLRPISGLIPTPLRRSTSTTSPTGRENPSGAMVPAGASAGKSGAALTPAEPGRWERAQLAPFNLPEEAKRFFSSSLLSAIDHVPTETRWGKDGQMMPSKLRFQMKLGMPRAEIQQNLRVVVAALARSRPDALAPIVATLKARTRGRAEGESEARFNANVLVNDLCDYPVDVVQSACDAWIDMPEGKWFPAWADLKALCEERVGPRRKLEKALNWMLEETPR